MSIDNNWNKKFPVKVCTTCSASLAPSLRSSIYNIFTTQKLTTKYPILDWKKIFSVHRDLWGGDGDQVRADGERGGQDHSVLQPHDQLYWRHPHLLWPHPWHLWSVLQGPRSVVSICMSRTVHSKTSLQVPNSVTTNNQCFLCRPSIC